MIRLDKTCIEGEYWEKSILKYLGLVKINGDFMNKWTKFSVIIGGIWGFISSILVTGGTLEPVGYAQYFLKATATHWVFYFPGMILLGLNYKLKVMI